MSQEEDPASALRGRLFVTPADAALVLGVDRRSLYRAIEAGQIPAVRVGQQWRIATAWLREAAHVADDGEMAA